MNAYEFRRLLLRHMNGDARAFEKIYQYCNRKLVATAFLFLHNQEDSISVADDVLVKLYNEPEEFLNINNPAGWLFISAKNGSLNLLKKESYRKKHEFFLHEDISANPIERNDEELDYFAVLRQFEKLEQELIVLRVEYGFSYRELAERDGLNVRQIKWKFKKIKSRIKRILNKKEANG